MTEWRCFCAFSKMISYFHKQKSVGTKIIIELSYEWIRLAQPLMNHDIFIYFFRKYKNPMMAEMPKTAAGNAHKSDDSLRNRDDDDGFFCFEISIFSMISGEGSISPIKKVFMCSLASLLWPASSNSSVASLPWWMKKIKCQWTTDKC